MSSTLDGKILYQRLKTLLEIFLLTSKTSDYDSVLRIITRYFKIFTDADASVLFLNNDNNNLTPVRSTGIKFSNIKDTYIPPSTRLKDIISRPVLDVRYASFMNTPLIQNRKLVGLSAVFSTSPEYFTLFEQNKYENLLLTMLASHIAVIIENVTLTNTITTNKIFKLDWKNLFDAVDDLLSIHDTNFNIVYANKAVANNFGMDVKNIIGNKCYKIFHGTNEPWPTCPHTTTLKTKSQCSVEIVDPHMKGTFHIKTFPYFDDTGDLTGSIHIAKNITTMKNIEFLLKQSE